MTPDSIPSTTTTESLPAYSPQLEAEDLAPSSGNIRLGIIVGALFTLGVLSYALAPASGGGGRLAAATPSFLLEGASVTASREAEPAPVLAAPEEQTTVSKAAVATASRVAPKVTAQPATASMSAAPITPGPTPLAASEVALTPAAAPAPAPVAEPARLALAPVTHTLSGRILDESGRPLVGATVLLKGSGKGTSTDANGHYELEAPAGDNSLIFGYGGYQDEEMRARGAQPLNVTLTPTPGVKRRRR